MIFADIKVGDKVAITNRTRSFGAAPIVRFDIVPVTKVTATQFTAGAGSSQHRIRKSDGRLLGDLHYRSVEHVTAELLIEHDLEVLAKERYDKVSTRYANAKAALSGRVTLETMEAIADAFEAILKTKRSI